MSATAAQNGHAPGSSKTSAREWMESAYVQQVTALLIERVLRHVHFSFTAFGVTWSVSVTPAGTTFAITYKEPECPSPDPEPSKAQSTDTETPA